jgi:hypothetical protein
LKPQERRLLAIMVNAGLIVKSTPYEAVALNKALITVSRMAPVDHKLLKLAPDDRVLSAAIFAHEISHGDFFTKRVYRDQSWQFWNKLLSENERQRWTVLLRRMGYDVSNEELLVNEVQALLMHTPDSRVFSASHLMITDGELANQRDRFESAGSMVFK